MHAKANVLSTSALGAAFLSLILAAPSAQAALSDLTGDGSSGSPYQIGNFADLLTFKAAVEDGTAGSSFFEQTADIDLATNLTDRIAWTGIGKTTAFGGTYDGKGFGISNVTFKAAEKYNGFFNKVTGGTVKNLSVHVAGVEPSASDTGAAAIVGTATGSVISNCVSSGSIVGCSHNTAGICVSITSGSIVDCVNNATIETSGSKCGGFIAIRGYVSPDSLVSVTRCVNNGKVFASGGTQGVSGIVAYIGSSITLTDCANYGKVAGVTGSHVGGFVGHNGIQSEGVLTFAGVNRSSADVVAVGHNVYTQGLCEDAFYARVDPDSYVTIVGESAFEAGRVYKVMQSGLSPTFALTKPGSIAFDESLCTVTTFDNVTGPDPVPAGYTFANTKVGNVTTFTLSVPVTAFSVAEGEAYTNVKASVTAGAAGVVTVSVKDAAGNVIGFTSAEVKAGLNENLLIDIAAAGAVPGKSYSYEIYDGSATHEGGELANYAWSESKLFSASAKTGSGYEKGGAWTGTAPTVDTENKVYKIEESADFGVAAVQPDNAILDVQCEIGIDSFYLLDDITNDVSGAIGALALVTNDEKNASWNWDKSWMILKDGTTWVAASGASAAQLKATNYVTRMEVDYTVSPAKIRYSVRATNETTWTVLTANDTQWFNATNATPKIAHVNFMGTASVAEFGAIPATTAIISVDGTEYETFAEALAAAGTTKTMKLYTNLALSPLDFSAGGTYLIDKNGKNIRVIEAPMVAPATSGGVLEVGDDKMTVKSGFLLAEIGDVFAKDGNPRYFSLAAAAAAATNNATISMIANDAAANAVIAATNVTLDLRGWRVTAAADKPAIVLDGANNSAFLINSSTTNAAVMSANANAAALVAMNGALIVLGDVAVTNSASGGVALLASGTDSIIAISNGCFNASTGTIKANDSGKVYIRGGYYSGDIFVFAAKTDIVGWGGRFSQDKDNAPISAATAYKFVNFGVPLNVGGVDYASEIVTNASDSVATTVWKVGSDDSVQIADTFADNLVDSGATAQEKQTALNNDAKYGGGMKNWHCYVLGMTAAKAKSTTTEGPYVKGVQDADSEHIGFAMCTPGMIKAAESGCKVEYAVEAFDGPSGSKVEGECSGRVNYDQNAKVPVNDSAVRYYKLKVYITPQK